ncbi:MAG: DPP IV N-terminal domain-containing protein, partial [Omnitrophica WOR_2 bacterium]
TMNADGSNPLQLTHGLADASSPSYSPDGNSIVFVVDQNQIRRIWVMDKSGNGAHAITPPYGKEDFSPAWSPDGQKIVFVSLKKGDRELYIMNRDGSNPVQLTQGLGNTGGKCSWSPDGNLIAFYAGQPTHHQIYTIHPDGSDLRAITTRGNNLAPSFSPDGQWITFTSYQLPDLTNYPEIWIMHPDGSGSIRLTAGRRVNWQPSWGR